MKSANDVQVGGDHYKVAYQHWDLMADLGVPYHEGQISKYITRHRQKGGLKDVQKCRHFLEKIRELVVDGRCRPTVRYDQERVNDFLEAHEKRFGALDPREQAIFVTALTWRSTNDLDAAISFCRDIEAGYAAAAPGAAG